LTILVDAGPLYAQADRRDPHFKAVSGFLRATTDTLVTTELVVAEADYLILDRLGPGAEALFVRDLAEGTYLSSCLSQADLGDAQDLLQRYADLRLGLADASLVIAARNFQTRRILTLDRRGFHAISPLQGGAFELLPPA